MASPLEAAQAELAEAGARQAEIDRLIAEQQKILDDLAAERKNKGQGRPNVTHSSKVKAAQSKIARLQRQGKLVPLLQRLGCTFGGKIVAPA